MVQRIALVLVFLVVTTLATADAAWRLDVEAAMVQAGRIDVRIPGDTGSDISFVDDLETDDDAAFRSRLGLDIGERQHVSVLVAPLRLFSSGTVDRPIDFNGTTFAAGRELEGTWQFNSYRATWRYDLTRSHRLQFGLGATAKVRDAYIELSDGETTTRKDDLGFVPLVHLRLEWRWGRALGLLIEADALAAPQGRAEDVLAALVVRPYAASSLRLGYRILEGGSDVDEVYNFNLIHYYTFGWSQRF
ncbi:hypothetical protein GF314_04320 [bacterium]|nr:hypothetical protein [bacterium]